MFDETFSPVSLSELHDPTITHLGLLYEERKQSILVFIQDLDLFFQQMKFRFDVHGFPFKDKKEEAEGDLSPSCDQ